MTESSAKPRRSLLGRCMRVATMLGVYGLATLGVSGIVMSGTITPAAAQRGGRGGGGGGGGRGGGGRGGGGGMARGGGMVRGGGGMVRGGARGGVVRGGVVRGGRGVVRGRGRGRGFFRGGIWFPFLAPGFCHHPWTSARVVCDVW
jgi:hypothetical protein